MCGVQPEPDSEYSKFLHAFLPEFDFLLASREDAEGGLDRLREYYAGLAAPGPVPGAAAGTRIAVIAIDPWRNWAAEVKAAALVADLVICDDPLLRDLPFMGASAGLSIAAAAAGGATPASTALGSLATLLGFSSVFQDLLRPETKVRREPAFVFWKLGVPGSPVR